MPNAEMKTLTIGDTTYEIVDEEAREKEGDLSELNTQVQTDLVAAINEVADSSGVVSVNGMTGTVVLTAADVGAATTGALTDEATARTAADAQLQTDVAVIRTEVGALGNGSPTPVATVAEMTDESAVYLYTGSETGYTAGNWYYYDGSDWTSGGQYGGAVTSTTFNQHGVPADDFAVGEALAEKADADDVGDLSQLETTAKDDLVSAINEAEADVEQLKADLSELSEAVDLVEYEQVHGTVESNKYIDGSGTVTTANTWSVETVEVDPDTEYVVTARAYNARYYFAFYTENNVFISGLKSEESGSTTIENYKVTAPSTAKYLSVVFVESIQSQRKIKKKITPYSAKIVKAETELEQVESALIPKYTVLTNGTTENGKYIDGGGVITEISNWTIESFPVMPSATYKIKAQAYNARYYFAFYDVGGFFISGEKSTESGTTVISGHIVTAPVNADTLVVVSTTAAPENRIAEYKEGFVPTGWHGKKWVAFGDSLTEANRRTSKHYYDYISEKTGISVYVMGDSGSGYASEQDLSTAFYQRISAVPTDADVITIFGSFNDLSLISGGSVTLGTKTDTGTTTIGGCVNKTLDNLFTAYPLANVGIVAPTPWAGANPTNEPNTASAYVQLLKDICEMRGIPFLDLFHCSQLRPWESAYRSLCYSKDDGGGTHPDETGHSIIAPRFESFLNSLLLH